MQNSRALLLFSFILDYPGEGSSFICWVFVIFLSIFFLKFYTSSFRFNFFSIIFCWGNAFATAEVWYVKQYLGCDAALFLFQRCYHLFFLPSVIGTYFRSKLCNQFYRFFFVSENLSHLLKLFFLIVFHFLCRWAVAMFNLF